MSWYSHAGRICRRLNLDSLELLLEVPDTATRRRVEVALRVLPPSWSLHVDMAREEIAWTLQTLSVNAIELSNLWYMQHFHEKLLVDVSSTGFVKQLPMEAYTFEQVRTRGSLFHGRPASTSTVPLLASWGLVRPVHPVRTSVMDSLSQACHVSVA